MEVKISQSVDLHDYEILIRKRGEGKYASYCPQLNLMLLGNEHEEVHQKMQTQIQQHIQELQAGLN